jgi:hypothetical protein
VDYGTDSTYDPFSDSYDPLASDSSGGGSSMIDLNNPDSYTVQDFGGGNLLYQDTSTGLYFDPNDLSTPLSTSQVQQYGAATNTSGATSVAGTTGTQSSQSSLHSPAPATTVNSPSSGGISTSGMSGMFTAIGSAFASVINPPKTPQGGQPLVYNAALGTYVPASSTGAALTNASSIPMWLVIGAVVIVAGIVFLKEK